MEPPAHIPVGFGAQVTVRQEIHIQNGVFEVVLPLIALEGIRAAHAQHAPRRNLPAIPAHGHGEHEQIQIIQPVYVGNIGGAVVIVEGAQPGTGDADIVGDAVTGDDAGHFVVEDGGTARRMGRGHGLEAHTHTEAGIGYSPVHKGMTHFHELPVSPEGGPTSAKRFVVAPKIVPHFQT